MKGLLLKDFYVLIKQLKIFLIAVPILSFSGGTIFLAFYLGGALPMTAFSYDERSKWNELAVMLPYSTKNIVLSKFVLGYISIAIICIITTLSMLFSQTFMLQNLVINYDILVVSLTATLIFLAINNTLTFKFGTEKTRLFYVIFLIATAAFTSILANEQNNAANISGMPPVYLLLLIAAIVNVIAIQISFSIVNKK